MRAILSHDLPKMKARGLGEHNGEQMSDINIIQAFEDPKLLGAYIKEKDNSFFNWKVFLKSVFALPMDRKELAIYKKFTDRQKPPQKPIELVYCISGRKSGKSLMAACLGVHIAVFEDFWKPHVRPGQKVYLPIIATDKVQAREIFNYCEGILNSNPFFKKQILKSLAWEIELVNSVVIMIRTANFKAIRGPLYCAALLDELAFMRDENSVNPADELIKGILPGLISGGKLIGISSAYARFGILYDEYREYWGKDDPDTLIWLSDTMSMNPLYDEGKIKRALKKDFSHARAEFFSIFREDLESFLSFDMIEDVVIPGRWELPPNDGYEYVAFCDFSSGRQDSSALAISHLDEESGKVILDCVKEKRPPFKPATAIEEFSNTLDNYGIYNITADKYAIGYVQEAIENCGISFGASDLNKSEIYLEFEPLVAQGQVELLDNERLINQLRSLERRTRSGGRDLIDHPRGVTDDVCNAVAGACVMASLRKQRDIARHIEWL